MDPNNNPFKTQYPSNYPFNYPNPKSYQFPMGSSNQQDPQNIPTYGFALNFVMPSSNPNFLMPSSNPNYCPYLGSMVSYSSQAPPTPNVGLDDLPEFSTQMTLGGMSGGHEATPNVDDSTPAGRKNTKWTTDQNLVLLSGWIKYGTDGVVGRNQKIDSLWGKLLITVMSTAHLILPMMELRAEIITTTSTKY